MHSSTQMSAKRSIMVQWISKENVFDMLNMEEVNTDTGLSENMHR